MGGLIDTLIDGGPIVMLLIVLSIFSLSLIVIKLLALRGIGGDAAAREAAFDAWSRGDRRAALERVPQGAPADRLLRQAMTGLIAGQPRPLVDGDLAPDYPHSDLAHFVEEGRIDDLRCVDHVDAAAGAAEIVRPLRLGQRGLRKQGGYQGGEGDPRGHVVHPLRREHAVRMAQRAAPDQ